MKLFNDAFDEVLTTLQSNGEHDDAEEALDYLMFSHKRLVDEAAKLNQQIAELRSALWIQAYHDPDNADAQKFAHQLHDRVFNPKE